MGNCFSANDAASLRDLFQRPGEVDRKLNKQEIENGLAAVANFLNSKKVEISIVAVGGAVNTIFLKTRSTTSDVDFFYRTKLKSEDVSKIVIAADAAAEKLKLGDGWLNNHTAIFIEEGMIATLYDEALKQNDIIFYQKGLRVYAAPWNYALLTKIDRLGKASRRDYDLDDAVEYLHKLIGKRGKVVSRSELKGWAVSFKFPEPKKEVIDEVAKAYKAKYKSDGIV